MTRQVTFGQCDGSDVVGLSGEIDFANAATIGREVAHRAGGAGPVLIDLTGVSFLDGAGVRLLDALVADLERQGRRVRLVVGRSGPARMTLLLRAFRDELLATDLDEAAAELGRGPAYPGVP
ncbi:anti-anti-sigma factor [Krasilnikovia cinnamomea]|uniref:Anti-anti-sigma factor n=1 Tax=Krasilnikovia cinnamomea TaxID=349313 RepID=A0A4Q7ZQB8_9ACTN|nr:STAS domain-containing protein [Krasilnikovia cinnamomea]RZU52559.1 anti-anti-sigma factor [Krasilnikovia cinnamomea]